MCYIKTGLANISKFLSTSPVFACLTVLLVYVVSFLCRFFFFFFFGGGGGAPVWWLGICVVRVISR